MALARLSTALARATRARSGESRPFWSAGTKPGAEGRLFGETPPPAGHGRKWESWEAVW